jgi:hypothetical protein
MHEDLSASKQIRFLKISEAGDQEKNDRQPIYFCLFYY